LLKSRRNIIEEYKFLLGLWFFQENLSYFILHIWSQYMKYAYILETIYLRHKVTIDDLYKLIYDLSFGIMTFDLEWPWKVKSRSNLRKNAHNLFFTFSKSLIFGLKWLLGLLGHYVNAYNTIFGNFIAYFIDLQSIYDHMFNNNTLITSKVFLYHWWLIEYPILTLTFGEKGPYAPSLC